jgi:hypothetical protein
MRFSTRFSVFFALLSGAVLAVPFAGTQHGRRHDAIAAGIAERTAVADVWRKGGKGTYFYPGLGACGWVRANLLALRSQGG